MGDPTIGNWSVSSWQVTNPQEQGGAFLQSLFSVNETVTISSSPGNCGQGVPCDEVFWGNSVGGRDIYLTVTATGLSGTTQMGGFNVNVAVVTTGNPPQLEGTFTIASTDSSTTSASGTFMASATTLTRGAATESESILAVAAG